MNGWIKLNRALNNWRYKTKPNYVALWVHLLTNANTKAEMVYDQMVERGCLLTSLEKLSKETGMSIQQVRTILKHLNGQEITYKSTNRFSLICIVKFDEYQGSGSKVNKQTNKQSTNDQQTTNNKQEYKEFKNIRNTYNMPMPVYDPSKNIKMTQAEIDELLKLRRS